MLYVVSFKFLDGGIMIQENYKILKGEYPESIILIKSGNFYFAINDDAIIMNLLFDYKIKQLPIYMRIGFPVTALNKITRVLTEKEINYIIFNNDDINPVKFNHNNYNNYIDKILDYELAQTKIQYIMHELNKHKLNHKIIDVLTEMERALCKINY